MTGPQRDDTTRTGRRGLPLDALAGPDGTQDPPPPPGFPDALSGLLTGDLLPRQRPAASPTAPVVPALDQDAVARAAEQLARQPVRRRANQPRSAQPPRQPAAVPRQPRAIAPAGSASARRPGQAQPPRRRMSAGSWLILLFVLAILAYNLLHSALSNLPGVPH